MVNETHRNRILTGTGIALHIAGFFIGIKCLLKSMTMMVNYFNGTPIRLFNQPIDNGILGAGMILGIGTMLLWFTVYALAHELEPYVLTDRTTLRRFVGKFLVDNDSTKYDNEVDHDAYIGRKYVNGIVMGLGVGVSGLIVAVVHKTIGGGQVLLAGAAILVAIYVLGIIGTNFKNNIENWT